MMIPTVKMATARKRLSQLARSARTGGPHTREIEDVSLRAQVIKQRKILKDSLQATKLMNMGLFEQASKLQAPTVQAIATIPPAISKTADDTKRELEQVRKAIEQSPQQSSMELKPLDLQSSEKAYSLVRIDAKVNTIVGDLPAWQFNSRSGNQGRIIVFEKGGQQYVWNAPKMVNPLTLTAGLKEILFNDASNENVITLEDINNWTELITSLGLGHSYKRSDLFKNKIQIIQNRLETMTTLQPKVELPHEGEGFKAAEQAIVIPSDPDKLRSEFVLQLAAIKAGNNNL